MCCLPLALLHLGDPLLNHAQLSETNGTMGMYATYCYQYIPQADTMTDGDSCVRPFWLREMLQDAVCYGPTYNGMQIA